MFWSKTTLRQMQIRLKENVEQVGIGSNEFDAPLVQTLSVY